MHHCKLLDTVPYVWHRQASEHKHSEPLSTKESKNGGSEEHEEDELDYTEEELQKLDAAWHKIMAKPDCAVELSAIMQHLTELGATERLGASI